MIAAFGIVALRGALGCGGDAPRRAVAAVAPRAGGRATAMDAGIADAGTDGRVIVLTLDELAARGSGLAAGMREAVRFELNGERSVRRDVVRATDRDVCARVAFAAGAPVHAWLEDASGAALVDGGIAESGVLGRRGPVCVRRGDAIIFRVETEAPALLRVVVWGTP